MEIVLVLIFTVVFVISMRLLGAWMLRINEIISVLSDILREIKK